MIPCVRLFQRPQLLILGIQFLAAVGVLIQIEYRAGEEPQEGVLIFILFFHRGRLVHRLGFHHLHATPD